jgi:hypothetical protein
VFASLDGQLARFDGVEWLPEGLDAERRVVDLLADEATSDVWAVEIDSADGPHSPTVQHYHDGKWARLTGAGPEEHYQPKLTKINGDIYVYSTDLWNVSRDWEMVDLGVGSVHSAEFVRDVLVRDGDVLIARSSGIFRLDGSVEILVLEGTYEALADAGDGETWIAKWTGGVAKVNGEHPSGPLAEPSNAERFQWGEVPAAVWAGVNVAWGASGNDVWAAPRRHFDGNEWTDVPGAGEFRSIDGSASDDVWFTDEGGVLSHWNGTTLERIESVPEDGESPRFTALEAVGRNDVWVVDQQIGTMRVLHFDGQQWSLSVAVPYDLSRTPLVPYLSSVAGNLWYSTNTELMQFDGSDWHSRVTFEGYQPLPISADAADVWVATFSQLFKWDGETLSERDPAPSPNEHLEVHGSALWAWGYNQVMVKEL